MKNKAEKDKRAMMNNFTRKPMSGRQASEENEEDKEAKVMNRIQDIRYSPIAGSMNNL